MNATAKRDMHQQITDQIIAALESGTAPWVKPWSATSSNPHNAATGHAYRGINLLILGMAPYASSGWLTYKQATDLGGNVRRGEHGTAIVFWKQLQVEDRADATKLKVIPMMKSFTVFNLEQCENLPARLTETTPVTPEQVQERNALSAKLMAQATVSHGGDRAFYRPSTDSIQLPTPETFRTPADYEATALHELTHWSGAPTRCNRNLNTHFGDEAYAREELVAELGAAFLCAQCGIDGKLQHESYIANWLKVLKGDKKAIFTASAAAQKAVDFITQCVAEEEEEQLAA